MTRNQAMYILGLYKSMNRKCDSMLRKIIVIQNNICSAQAGFVECKTGVKIIGGSHIAREEIISELADLKDQFAERYLKSEVVCKNILELIERIATKKISQEKNTPSEILELQKFEMFLTEYYINNITIKTIGKNWGYSERQAFRILNNARDYFYKQLKTEDYSNIMHIIQN